MRISVIIPTRNRPVALAECLRSLENQSTKPDEVIVVINDQDHKTKALLSNLKLDLDLKCIAVSEKGSCTLRNRGIAASCGDVVVFLDDDVVVPPSYIERVSDLFRNDGISIVTGYVFDRVDLTSPQYVRKGDLEFIRKNPNHEITQIILERIPQTSLPYYGLRLALTQKIVVSLKYLFLYDWPLRGRILPSGYRSRMPEIDDINLLRKVEWVFGGNFAIKKDILRDFEFNEGMEIHPYVLNEDLEFSARVGRRHEIFISSKLAIFHSRSEEGIKLPVKERFCSLVTSTFLISKMRGNLAAFVWSLVGLILYSIVAISFSHNGVEKFKGVVDGIRRIREMNENWERISLW